MIVEEHANQNPIKRTDRRHYDQADSRIDIGGGGNVALIGQYLQSCYTRLQDRRRERLPCPLNVNLTEELDSFVLAKVESGRYENASEVVRAALRTLEREEHH